MDTHPTGTTEALHSSVALTKEYTTIWKPGNPEQARSRITRGRAPLKVKLVRHGRYWTEAGLHSPIPRKFLFKTYRAAKRFFSLPIVTNSPTQFISIFGPMQKPGRTLRELQRKDGQ